MTTGGTVNIKSPLFRIWPIGMALLLAALTGSAAPVARLQVRVVTGAVELNGGSVLELRVYEAGKPVRRLPLSHGEAWPRDSTRLIPLTLAEPLETRAVSRFALYYRASSPLSPPLEIVAADVEVAPGRMPAERLLNATLSGVIAHQGELASEERDTASMLCVNDADCDDHRNCNGHERCAPRTAGADARGCVKGSPVSCPVNEVCSETRGCLGTADFAPK
jgi:hypothetical protein